MDRESAKNLASPHDSLTLTVLGAGAPYAQPDRSCSGYLLRAGDHTVWVDTGPGTLAALQRFVTLESLSAVWISHLHADHAADLLGAYYALGLCGVPRPAPLPVFAPRGCADRLAGYFAETGTGFLDTAFVFHDLYDGHEWDIEGLRLTSAAVVHSVETFALRVDHAGACITYSGDSAPCDALEFLAMDSDILLCEAGDAHVPEGAHRRHHTPEEAAALAQRAGVRELILTHLAPALTPAEALRRASPAFAGRIHTAEEGRTHTAG